MKKACVFVFSGTGMTRYVVDKIVQGLGHLAWRWIVAPLETAQVEQVPLGTYDLLGIAYPVHAFNAPQIVINFAKQLQAAASSSVFLISTAGENNPVNYSSSHLLIKTLRKRTTAFFMTSSFICLPTSPFNTTNQRQRHTCHRNRRGPANSAHNIASGVFDQQTGNTFSRFMHLVGRAEWFGSVFIGKLFYADRNCSHCGLCAKNCPNHNITSGANLHFKWNCGLCMRCLYLCPRHAIRCTAFYLYHF